MNDIDSKMLEKINSFCLSTDGDMSEMPYQQWFIDEQKKLVKEIKQLFHELVEEELKDWEFCCGGDMCCGGYPECENIKFGEGHCSHSKDTKQEMLDNLLSALEKGKNEKKEKD